MPHRFGRVPSVRKGGLARQGVPSKWDGYQGCVLRNSKRSGNPDAPGYRGKEVPYGSRRAVCHGSFPWIVGSGLQMRTPHLLLLKPGFRPEMKPSLPIPYGPCPFYDECSRKIPVEFACCGSSPPKGKGLSLSMPGKEWDGSAVLKSILPEKPLPRSLL